MLTFKPTYFLLTIILFLTEVSIALFVKDKIIRPFVGDVLVVILIFCFLRTFLQMNVFKTAFGVLIFAFSIEILQYFDFVKLIGMENNRIISTALGRTFEWLDFIAYFIGFLLIFFFERIYERYQTDQTG